MKRLLVVAFIAAGGPAFPQALLDTLEADAGARAGELKRIRDILNNPDPDLRVAAMEKLMASGDTLYMQEARAIGLYSDDPRLRAAAIKGTFDAGGVFTAQFEIGAESQEQTPIFQWLESFRGSWSEDKTRGSYTFTLGPFDEDKQCWKFKVGSSCALALAGETVSIGSWNAAATLVLDDTGALVGDFVAYGKGSPVTLRIPLDF